MEIIKKHLLTILCLLAIVLLALPLASVKTTIEIFGESSSKAVSVNGFRALDGSIFAFFLLIGPAILIAMNYIKQIQAYKGILAIAVPIICLLALILVIMDAKSFTAAATSGNSVSKVTLSVGIGSILTGLDYLAIIICGAVTYHNFSLEQVNLEKIKNATTGFAHNAQEKIQSFAQSHAGSGTSQAPSADPASPSPVRLPQKKSPNLSRIDEILSLIERLAKMKDAGILTDEEFSDKKKQLLEEIQ